MNSSRSVVRTTPAVARGEGRRLTIGLINDTSIDPNSASIWAGVNEVTAEHDANLICYPAGNLRSPRGFDAQANVLFDLAGSPRLDGLVFWTPKVRQYCTLEDTRDFLDRYDGLPIVSIADPIGAAPTTMLNNYQGMTDVAVHLIEAHGCRRIALISGPELHPETQERYQAYHDVLAQQGIEVDPLLIAPGDFKKESGRAAIGLLFDERGLQPDAVLAMNDLMAIGAMEALSELGFRVPHDIPVAGFDDIDEARQILPQLTTVKHAFQEQGRTAAAELFKLMAGADVDPRRVLTAPLVIRQSCGCLDPLILDAGADDPRPADGGGLDAFRRRTGQITELMAAAADHEPGIGELVGDVVDGFQRALSSGDTEAFLRLFVDTLRRGVRTGERASLWHAALSALRRCALADLRGGVLAEQAETLLHQARVMVGETALQASGRRIIEANEQAKLLNEISQSMLSVFEREELLSMIAAELPRLGIRLCFLSVYEDPAAPTEWARLILAYDETGRHSLEQDGIRFQSRLLVPEGMLPSNRRYHLIVEPLYFRERQIGFAVLDAAPMKGVIYDTLRASLSSALEGERLVRGLDLRTKELTAAYSNLEANQQKLIISEKVASLGRLTAGIAHEMNTPLAAIRAAVMELRQLVDEYQRSIDHPDVQPEDHRAIATDMLKNLEIADTAAEKSAGFIRGVKAQTIDVKEKRQQAFPAAPVIRDTLTLLEFALRKGRCTLTTDVDETIQLFGDPRGLSQILTNLITNGVEACAPAGTIMIVFERADDRANLRVTDSGSGIPADVLQRIFEPLFTTKPFGQGTGLGLAITHDLVKEFNGTVRVESRPGETSFFISFPLDRRSV